MLLLSLIAMKLFEVMQKSDTSAVKKSNLKEMMFVGKTGDSYSNQLNY